jgi:hypothetical protein
MTARRYVVFGNFDSSSQRRDRVHLWAYDVKDACDQARLLWRHYDPPSKRYVLGDVHSIEPWHELEHGHWEAHVRDGA